MKGNLNLIRLHLRDNCVKNSLKKRSHRKKKQRVSFELTIGINI